MPSGLKGLTLTVNRELIYHLYWLIRISNGWLWWPKIGSWSRKIYLCQGFSCMENYKIWWF